mmetsp:Transcript_39158/g.34846  ORF Transcript_39158/g.34846 Transcript_39158/m.34846 type:complete len:166 (+) Transcript_39158:61-558(+)
MEDQTIYATCILQPDGGSNVSGLVKFIQEKNKPVLINATVKNLSKGEHGFHIHQFGNLTEGCKSAGPHYNPFGLQHGGPKDEIRHVGDLGNVISDGTVDSELVMYDNQIQLVGPYSIIGRSVVTHADPDDLGKGGHADSKTTGHAGARLACCTIGLSGPFDFKKP